MEKKRKWKIISNYWKLYLENPDNLVIQTFVNKDKSGSIIVFAFDKIKDSIDCFNSFSKSFFESILVFVTLGDNNDKIGLLVDNVKNEPTL